MSLLMDALKRAEESKRLAEGKIEAGTSAQPPAVPLDPAGPPRGPVLPDLSLHYDSVDADLAAVPTEAPPLRRASANAARPSIAGSREASDRAAARNVFAAKKSPARRPNELWLFVGLSGIVAIGVCIYFWWQLQTAAKGSLSQPVMAPPVAQTVTPQAETPGVPSLPETLPAIQSSADTDKPISGSPSEDVAALHTATEPRPTAMPKAAPRKDTPVASPIPPDDPVRLSRSQPKANQTLERAYAALQAGRLDDAQRDYESVLRNDARNVDALLGMATLAVHRGQNEWAQAYYQRALESDPNDPTAKAGLINSRGAASPGSSESQLKMALSGQPDSAPLYFALGNLYARQDRWSEAQQAYFRAYTIESGNPDFMFNLAVSLDHLHQDKLAAQYYQMAVNAAGTSNASFDRQQVAARLRDLQP